MNFGWMPRYSISEMIDMRCCVMAQNRPSTSFIVSPQSASAREMPCAHKSIGLISSATWPRSDSAAPTIAAAPRFKPSITRPPE